VTIHLYRASDNAEIYSASDAWESESTWANQGQNGTITSYLSYLENGDPSPITVSASGGSVTFPSTGSLSFSAASFTYKLNNLPSGYSTSYEAGTVYIDENNFLKVAP
jgi:hypothetical protein